MTTANKTATAITLNASSRSIFPTSGFRLTARNEPNAKRGDYVKTSRGSLGLFVGRSPGGIDYVAEPYDFGRMCDLFDRRHA